MAGLGTDIIEIRRIEQAIARERFQKRVYTEAEREWLRSRGENLPQSAAGLFCAKEAVAKALGTGFGAALSFQDIEIGHTAEGAPVVLRPAGEFLLSISHCQEYAVATALLMTENRKKAEE
ncbi:MAG: holo-ACP synthase [Eubacteriales bacterium]|nr:holo-ACP synthase [Eubacteriales bacterium]